MSDAFAVGFDFDHTLGMDNGLEVTAFYRFATALGHPLDRADPHWAAAIDAELSRFRLAEITLDACVETFVARLGLQPVSAAGERYRALCYALVDELVTPVEGAREVIAELDARGIPHAILTNGWSPLQYLKIARALDYRGTILVSDELGILKPDPAAFGKLVDVLGVARDRVWFVGDNPNTDILGAHNAGLRSVWFDWESVTYPVDARPPDKRIERLPDLLAMLRGRSAQAEKTSG